MGAGSPVTSPMAELPSALSPEFARLVASRRPALFLDYDGTLTPIVGRPQDAVLSERTRTVVSELAERCPVCVVSGRDREVLQALMGVGNLTVAGSHGFDIWTPDRGVLERRGAEQAGLIKHVTEQLRRDTASIPGVLIEPKALSVAVHFRQVPEGGRGEVLSLVDAVLREHAGELKITPGKMVREIQPNVDWDKGRAVLYLLHVLGLESADVLPIYLGDDETDEHAFIALAGRGVGILVLGAEEGGQSTAARFVLRGVAEVERFLDTVGR